jgi:hypothetical protein
VATTAELSASDRERPSPPLYIRALAIQEQGLGADDPELAGILKDYAALLWQTRRVLEAEKLEQRARAIRVKR